MKIAKFFAVIFAVVGVVLMLGTAVVCFASMDAAAKLMETPDGAVECVEKMVAAIDAGDLTAAGKRMYGTPDLGAEGLPSDGISAMLWEKYRNDMCCTATRKLYLEGSDFAADVTVTVLDVASVIDGVQTRARTLLEEKMAAATDMAELYDEDNSFREELVDQVLQEALEQAIRQDAKYVTQDATFRVINRDGQWWAVPDQALLQALAGGAA